MDKFQKIQIDSVPVHLLCCKPFKIEKMKRPDQNSLCAKLNQNFFVKILFKHL